MAATLPAGAPTRLTDPSLGPERILAQAGAENFPVASRLLPRRVRGHLMALYGFARLVDDAGDEAAGDRLALLDEIAADLDRVFAPGPGPGAGDSPRHTLLQRLQRTVRACHLPREPFQRLIEANRRDQRQPRYQTFADLQDYCRLSANPVGELVLGVLGAATPRNVALSDSVCTGLQLVEHWQDVAEDYRKGRVYLPREDLERFNVPEQELAAPAATPAFKRLLAFESQRAHELLSDGAPLIRALSGRPALAVAAFVAGGRAALTAIHAAGYDVLGQAPRPGRAQTAAELLRTLRTAPRTTAERRPNR